MNKTLFAATSILLLLAWSLYPLGFVTKFYIHMMIHMFVVAIASPMIAIAVSPMMKFSRMPLIWGPLTASVAELIIVWAWHAPKLHHFARTSSFGLVLEQGSFLLAGIWLWVSSIHSREAGVIGLFLTSMHMTFLGALLGLSHRSFFHHHLLEDQQLGGAIMIVMGGCSYLSGGLWLTLKMLKREENEKLA